MNIMLKEQSSPCKALVQVFTNVGMPHDRFTKSSFISWKFLCFREAVVWHNVSIASTDDFPSNFVVCVLQAPDSSIILTSILHQPLAGFTFRTEYSSLVFIVAYSRGGNYVTIQGFGFGGFFCIYYDVAKITTQIKMGKVSKYLQFDPCSYIVYHIKKG